MGKRGKKKICMGEREFREYIKRKKEIGLDKYDFIVAWRIVKYGETRADKDYLASKYPKFNRFLQILLEAIRGEKLE